MPDEKPLTAEESEWKGWLMHSCTKRLRDWAKVQIEMERDAWENRSFTDDTAFKDAVRNAEALGGLKVLRAIEAMEFSTFDEREDDASDQT